MQTEKKPYELLIRWDQAGTLAGAQVQHRYVIKDGDVVIGETLGGAEPLTLDTAASFPLGDLLSQVQEEALTGKAAADAERDAAFAERDAAVTSANAARDKAIERLGVAVSAENEARQALASAREAGVKLAIERDAALARVAELEAQLAALRPAAE